MKHPTRTIPGAKGFTLVEMLATIVILAVICLGTVSIMSSVSKAYANAAATRRAGEQVAMALDRIVRVLRECPGQSAVPQQPDISTATTSTITFANGTSIALSGSVLNYTSPTTTASPLCSGVTTFQLTYLGNDGATLNFAGGDTTSEITCVVIRLAAQGIDLRTVAFIRTTIAG